MVGVKKEGVILSKTELGFESKGVLNPGIIKEGKHVHMFYRAIGNDNYSSIGYCKLNGPLNVEIRNETPILFPSLDAESKGTEDPRIVKIDDLYFLTYTAYNGVNALGALATSTDLLNFKKQGLIVPQITYDEFKRLAESKGSLNEKYLRYNEQLQIKELNGEKVFIWDKNLIFFPRRIDGKIYFIHRIKPDIQIVCVDSLSELSVEFWLNYFMRLEENAIVLKPKYNHEVSYIGGGCPPIETDKGWILIYHGVCDTINGYVYSACAALLDLKNPQKEIARLPYPLFKPEFNWETNGKVNNVCFPTGTALFDETLYIYYGAADEQIACASININELIEELLINQVENGN